MNKSRARRLVLEPRVLFDAAIAETFAAASVADATEDAGSPAADLLTALADIPAAGASVTEVVFIDSRVEGASALAQQMQAGNRSVFILDDASSGLEQMSRLLSPYDNLSGIHIISHGSDGAILLGAGQVSRATLLAESGRVASLGAALSAEGDILLYGCDIASTDAGKAFVATLGQLSGADVAASDDTTGVGGDLDLEFASGLVEQQVASALQTYGGNLSLEAYKFAEDNGDATGHNLGQFMEGSGDWVVVGTDGGSEAKIYKVVSSTLTEYDVAAPGTANGGASVTWTATFGQGVAIQGDTMVIVDPNATFTTDNSGAAHANGKGVIAIYQLDNTITSGNPWVHVRTVKITNSAANSGIGPWGGYGSYQYVAVDGNHIAIGAPNEGSGSGRVYWVAANTQNATSGKWDWGAAITLGKFDEAARGASNDSPRFGASVDIAKSGLIVGAPEWDQDGDDSWLGAGDNNHGRVFVYQWDEGTTSGPTSGDAYSFILNGDPDTGAGGDKPDAHFGSAVAIEYNAGRYTFVVGAPQEGGDNGEVYLYQTAGSSVGGTRTVTNYYEPLNYDPGGQFGSSVALSQAKMLIGSNSNNQAGKASVWYFEDADGIWASGNLAGQGSLALTPTALGYGTAAEVGRSLALVGGNLAIIGAPLADVGATDTGNIQFRYIRTPVAVGDSGGVFTATENGGTVSLNVLSNDVWGTESSATTPVTIVAGSQNGAGTFTWNNTTRRLEYNPGSNFEYLSVNDYADITVKYQLTVGTWVSQATVVVRVTGENDSPQTSAPLSNITVPLTNEPNQTPAGPSSVSTGNITIPTNTFFDIDQSDILTYTLVSVTPVGAAPAAPNGFVGAVGASYGSYNKVTGVNTGNIAYNLTGMTANTSYVITVRASDGQGGTATTSFTFNVARANQNPELVGGGVPNFGDAIEDSDPVFTKNLAGYFTDPDLPAVLYPESLSYSIVSQTGPGPSWLSVSAGGMLAGAASNDNVGVHTVIVRATDIFGNYIQDSFTVTVGNTNDAPVLTNEIDRKIAIRGETFSFNVTTGQVAWNGNNQPLDDAGPYFTDIDNSTADGRSPSSGDVITYRAYDALTGQEFTTTAGSTNASWLRFNGTSFTGTPNSVLGKVITIRLDAIDRIGGAAGPIGGTASTLFEIGVFPRDGSGAIGTGLPGIENGGRLGFDTAINSDSGRWMVVGEPGGANGSGEIHIYENTTYGTATAAPSWTFRNSFSTAAADARLGTAVDISADGRYIIAGAPLENGGAGAVYYFSNTTQVAGGASGAWVVHTTAKGVSPDAAAGDRFGSAVAINESGGFVLVGAPQDDEAGTNAGASYMFGFGSATGGGKRLPTVDSVGESRAGDLYGSSVAFDQNMLVVGAPRDDHSGKADAGSAYVYSTDNASFAKLKKTDGIGQSDYFGTNVDVESFDGRNRVVVVVGTPNDDALANNAGAVYVYRSDGMVADNGNGDGALTTLLQQSRITAYDGDALENFGYSVAVDVQGDTAAGALRIAVGGDLNGTSTGSAYAYRYYVVGGVSGWVGQRYLAVTDASTVNASNQYGFSVDIAGSRFVVGAPNADRTGTAAAGIYYSFNVAAGTPASPIETTPASFSGGIEKELGTGLPSPVMVGSQDSLFPAPSASLTYGRLEELLKPVDSWRLEAPAANQPLAEAGTRATAGESAADGLLFDLRTLKGKKLARLVDVLDGQRLEIEVAPQGEAPVEAPAPEAAAPAEGQDAAPAAPVQGDAAALTQGFSLQLQSVQAARSRQQADRLLSSLSSLSA